MNFTVKKNLIVLCDHCMDEMNPVKLVMPDAGSAPALYCDRCDRVYTPAGGYRDNPANRAGDEKGSYLMRCEKDLQALCITGFAGAGNERMKLICPVEGCDSYREAELSNAFQRGY